MSHRERNNNNNEKKIEADVKVKIHNSTERKRICFLAYLLF